MRTSSWDIMGPTNNWWPKSIDISILSPKFKVITNLFVTWIMAKGIPISFDKWASFFPFQSIDLRLQWSWSRRRRVLHYYRGSRCRTERMITFERFSDSFKREMLVEGRLIRKSFPIKGDARNPFLSRTIEHIFYNMCRMTSNRKAEVWTSRSVCSNEGGWPITVTITRHTYKVIIYMGHGKNKDWKLENKFKVRMVSSEDEEKWRKGRWNERWRILYSKEKANISLRKGKTALVEVK